MIEIEVRGRRNGRSDDDLPTVLVRLSEERTTAGELIRRAVEEQIRELRADAARCRRILDRQYLSDDEIRAQAATGAIRPPRRMTAGPDVAEEVARAQRAFARGTFVVFVGGRQVVGLDQEITLLIGEPVVFLRLVALTGG
ncbi:hypothetical protein LZ318_28845 [Saccharopolyspora indica]|uniref:hypothetical protein n=1 Tax=Saccharopolyspora indica TaxID=1229659 RepID=UPI0022EA5A26|nr:hypothetical protein [Saccharopolyspora indica]MDA3646307.1 hypothetical protein [Saccharopolyspora indica]